MKILHYLSVVKAEVGGPARAVVDLCAGLSRRGHQVTLATSDDTDVPAAWKSSAGHGQADLAVPPGGTPRAGNPRVVRVAPPARRGGLFNAAQLAELESLIREHDVLHLHGAWGTWNTQLGKSAKKLGVPYFVSIRGMLDDWCMTQKRLKKMIFLKLAGTRFYEGATAVHLTAQFEYEQAKKYFPRGRGVVIPNLLDLEMYKELPGSEQARAKFPIVPGRPTLLFLSRIHVKKGVETLLRAARVLHDRGTPCTVIIAGTGEPAYVDSLKRLAGELKLDGIAHFVGLVVDREKLSLYQASDLFVLPTSQENFGFVFVEALACGTPVVTTKGVDIWPELEEGGGSVIADATPEATADACARLLADPARVKAMGTKGREWVFQWLAADRVLSQFEAMYGEGTSHRA